jgi:predicted RNA-binding Zn-ribbon protein involved in translation (DUF1610 family)
MAQRSEISEFFSEEGHLTGEGAHKMAMRPGTVQFTSTWNYLEAHIASCEPCRQLWNEYRIEHCT